MIPINLLPIDLPIAYDPSRGDESYFYNNVTKHLIKDVITIMNNGIPIDLDRVDKLNTVVSNVLDVVASKLASNRLIEEFNASVYPKRFEALKEEQDSKKRPLEYYIKEYNGTIPHRTAVVNYYLSVIGKKPKDKWTIKDLKGLNIMLNDNVIKDIIDGNVDKKLAESGMLDLAKQKLDIYNKSIDNKTIDKSNDLLPPFNPASSKQKIEFFEWLSIEAINVTDSGLPSWNRKSIEMLLNTTTDEDLKEVLQLFIDHSFSAIIKNNFIEAFKRYTIDGVLYGNVKLFGAKTFRLTSNAPNLLNMPSSGSIYAKPLKECFVAPKGYVVVAIDLDQLEDRVVANISKDSGKCGIFLDGIDSHIYNSLGYYKDEYSKLMELTDNLKEDAIKAKELMDNGNKQIKELRQRGKAVTFKLSYGGYPDVDKGGVITQEIFDTYHDELYPGLTKLREEYILPQVKARGYTHLGLGCRLYSGDIDKDSRTIWNANSQFWSIITLLTINKLHSLIEDRDIRVIATIYDSIYMIVKEDVETIHWLNNTIVPIITTPIFKNEIVHNTATIEVGRDWANLIEVENEASRDTIKNILKELE